MQNYYTNNNSARKAEGSLNSPENTKRVEVQMEVASNATFQISIFLH